MGGGGWGGTESMGPFFDLNNQTVLGSVDVSVVGHMRVIICFTIFTLYTCSVCTVYPVHIMYTSSLLL